MKTSQWTQQQKIVASTLGSNDYMRIRARQTWMVVHDDDVCILNANMLSHIKPNNTDIHDQNTQH
jgi:hypothetical protein